MKKKILFGLFILSFLCYFILENNTIPHITNDLKPPKYYKYENSPDPRFTDFGTTDSTGDFFYKRIRHEHYKIDGIKLLKIHKSDGVVDQIYTVIDPALIYNKNRMEKFVNDCIIAYESLIGNRTQIRFIGSAKIALAMHRDDMEFMNKNKQQANQNHLGDFYVRNRLLIRFPNILLQSKKMSLELSNKAATILEAKEPCYFLHS